MMDQGPGVAHELLERADRFDIVARGLQLFQDRPGKWVAFPRWVRKRSTIIRAV